MRIARIRVFRFTVFLAALLGLLLAAGFLWKPLIVDTLPKALRSDPTQPALESGAAKPVEIAVAGHRSPNLRRVAPAAGPVLLEPATQVQGGAAGGAFGLSVPAGITETAKPQAATSAQSKAETKTSAMETEQTHPAGPPQATPSSRRAQPAEAAASTPPTTRRPHPVSSTTLQPSPTRHAHPAPAAVLRPPPVVPPSPAVRIPPATPVAGGPLGTPPEQAPLQPSTATTTAATDTSSPTPPSPPPNDGADGLGPASVALASGTGLMVAGVGLEASQPGTMTFTVDGTPMQVLLYWSGHFTAPNTGDGDVSIEGRTAGTIGETTPEPATGCPDPNFKYGNQVTLASPAFVTSLGALMQGDGGTGSQQFRMMIYSSGGGSPANLLATSDAVSVAGNASQGMVTFPLATDVYLPAGDYWLAQQSGAQSGTGHGCDYATPTATNAFNADSFADGPSAVYGSAGTEQNLWSFSAGTLDAVPVTGTSIGDPTCFFALGGSNPCDPGSGSSNVFQTFRADITSLGLVQSGPNTLVLGGLAFHANDGGAANADATGPDWPDGNDGAGVVVVTDDGSGKNQTMGLHDGQDLSFFRFAPPLDATAAQTFTFPASSAYRTANLASLASSVAGPASGLGDVRPNELVLTFAPVGGSQRIENPWASTSGPEFDALDTQITIPAGATSLTVQALSEPDPANPSLVPASMNWIVAALSVPQAG